MTEENKDEASFLELEAKVPAQSSNKDLWLFLIIVDVVFLCIFGVFLYKNLSVSLLSAETLSGPAVSAQAEESLPVEKVESVAVAETVTVPEEPVITQAPVPAAEPAPEVKPEPAAAPVQPEKTSIVEDKKENILVKENPKSKYRQVTFRYYGEGESVAVVSGFTMAKPRALKKQNGYWETTLAISPGTYKYLYIVDGKQTLDPYAETKDGRSVLVLE